MESNPMSPVSKKNFLSNNTKFISMLFIFLILIILGIIALVLLNNNYQSHNNQNPVSYNLNPPLSAPISSPISIFQPTHDEFITRHETLYYNSGNTDIMPNMKWDLRFLLPTNENIEIQKLPESGGSPEKLMLYNSKISLEIDGALDGTGGPNSQPPAREIVNNDLSSSPIYRINNDVEDEWWYGTLYSEECSGLLSPQGARYCLQNSISEKSINIYCHIKENTSEALELCDEIVAKMSAEFTKY